MSTRADIASLTRHAEDWLTEVNESRHTAVRKLWEQYRNGEHETTQNPSPEPQLELIPHEQLFVNSTQDIMTEKLIGIDVRNLAAPDYCGVNFMGYDPKEKCLAFRGEMRLLDAFLDFAYGVASQGHIESAFQASPQLKFPHGGLQAGLGYEEFAGRVEIVEYAMWIKEAQSVEDEGNETMTLVGVMRDGEEVPSHAENASPNHEILRQRPAAPATNHRNGHSNGTPEAADQPRIDPTTQSDIYMSQMESDAAMAAALEAEASTRYSLRTRTPSKPPPHRPAPAKSAPSKAPRTKKGIAQKKPKRQ